MVVDPVLVAAEAVPGVEHRRMLVGNPGELIEPAAGQRAEAVEMRLQPAEIIRLQIEFQKIAQAAIDGVEVLPGAIRRDVVGAAAPTTSRRIAPGRTST